MNICIQTNGSKVIDVFNIFQPHPMHWPRPSRPPWRTRTWTRSRGRVDIENNITLEPEVWMKSFKAFLKAEKKQNSMAMSLTSRQNWFSCFGVTKVKWLTIPLQNVLVLDQPALMCLPHQSALPEEDVAIHHQGIEKTLLEIGRIWRTVIYLLVMNSIQTSLLPPYRCVVLKIMKSVTFPWCPASSQESKTLRKSSDRPLVPKLWIFSIYFNPSLCSLSTTSSATATVTDVVNGYSGVEKHWKYT